MHVSVQLFAALKRFAPADRSAFDLELPEIASIDMLIAQLDIPDQVERVVLVNGRHAAPGQTLCSNDAVVMFPPMTGG